MQLQKATRKKSFLKLNISGPSGSGKTMSALLMAFGLVGDWEKIAVIDTENGSASLYSHVGEFNTIDLAPPFSPERYIQAIDTCLRAGMECIILDSSSHEWSGPGGCIEINEKLAQAKYKNNTWSAWNETTPRHDAFVQKVLQSRCHFITCTRSKMETVMSEDKKVKKVGMKDIQRDGWEYELTASLNLDRDTHTAIASKDRTNLFECQDPFIITAETGKLIADWCAKGLDTSNAINEAIEKLQNCDTVEELTMFKETLPSFIILSDEFKAAGRKRYEALTATKQADPAPEQKVTEPEAKKIEGVNEIYDKIIAEINECKSKKDVLNVYSKYKETVDSDPELQKILKESQQSFSNRKAA